MERCSILEAQNQIDANFPREGWQPTRALSGVRYVGSKVCAECHLTESAQQPSTPMGQALSPIAGSEILRLHSRLSTRLGRYSYSIVTERGGATYTVSTGGHSIIATLLWAVGNGRAG